MAIYQIVGARSLSGEIKVPGSANASLPIICASLLTKAECILRNVPNITDVHNLLAILKSLGSKIAYDAATHTLTIDNSEVSSFAPPADLVRKFRGSILLIGPLLARFKQVMIPFPGGDLIGKRPIDTHLLALKDLGAEVAENPEMLELQTKGLRGALVILNEFSVTATENTIMAAATAAGRTEIHIAAAEPHVQDLCKFLNAMGARISGVGTHDLIIEGVSELHGADHTVIFDNEVASSYINLAAATKSDIRVTNIEPKYLYSAIIQWRQMCVNLEVSENAVRIKKPTGPYKAAKIKCNLYPGLMTDYLPPFAALATQAEGESMIHEWMYEGRLGYIHELAKMGAKAFIMDQHRALITGPTRLHGTNVSSLDVRSGAVLIIAALIAEGKSVLHDVEHVERKYENILGVLQSLGADVQRIDNGV